MLLPVLFAVTITVSNPPPLKWRSVAPGVWRAVIGRKERLTLLSAAQAAPMKEALGRLPRAESPPIYVALAGGEIVEYRAVARIPLLPYEKLFGLGPQMHGANWRGGVYHLRMHHYSRSQDGLHAPTPL